MANNQDAMQALVDDINARLSDLGCDTSPCVLGAKEVTVWCCAC